MKIFLQTYGCQMNIRDSEVIKGLILADGFKVTDEERDNPDAVLFVTCSVRQHAEDRVWSEIGKFCKLRPKPVIGLIGCMAENHKDGVFKRMPGIDLVVGTNNIGEIPQLLSKIFDARRGNTKDAERLVAVSKKEREESVYDTEFRAGGDSSLVVISEGCDNFCAYCLVPYVRGGIRHRKPENILKEIESSINKGIRFVTLIGQNVNAYRQDSVDFVKLLGLVNSLKGLKEFSFVTSHPKDVPDNLFEAMAVLNKLKKSLHLPVQSGSDRILAVMKRGYAGGRYLELASGYRKSVPGGALTTDIIVGFPGETEDDFEKTLDLVRRIRFNSAYIFKYSPRPHTEAAKLKDDVPRQEKERRHGILLEAQKQISKELKNESSHSPR